MQLAKLFVVFFCVFGFFVQAQSATELQDRLAISTAAKSAFMRDNFAQLEETARAYRIDKSRTSSGLWKLTLFYSGLQDALFEIERAKDVEDSFRQIEEKLSAWAAKYPNSPTPHIVLSMAHIDHAWAIRGSGYSNTVKPEAWGGFNKYIALARQNLESNKAIAAVDPRWYETMMIVARGGNWGRAEFDQLLAEALDKEPAFYQTYFRALEYLSPKWHGGREDIEAFARDAVRRTVKTEGQGMYARIYWYGSQSEFRNKIFSDSLAAWPAMRAGFDDVIAKYPDSWNLNNYAKFACLAKDKAKLQELLKQVKPALVLAAWDPHSEWQRCSAWAGQP